MNPAGTRARNKSSPRMTKVADPGLLICFVPFTVEPIRGYSLVRDDTSILSLFREFCSPLRCPAPAQGVNSTGFKLQARTRKHCTFMFFFLRHGGLAACGREDGRKRAGSNDPSPTGSRHEFDARIVDLTTVLADFGAIPTDARNAENVCL
jgi:hypothetical protein